MFMQKKRLFCFFEAQMHWLSLWTRVCPRSTWPCFVYANMSMIVTSCMVPWSIEGPNMYHKFLSWEHVYTSDQELWSLLMEFSHWLKMNVYFTLFCIASLNMKFIMSNSQKNSQESDMKSYMSWIRPTQIVCLNKRWGHYPLYNMSHDQCFKDVTWIILPSWLGPRDATMRNHDSLVYYEAKYWVTIIVINLTIHVLHDTWC